ncbi:MAG: hypothetical protein HYR85_11300 [Planctomycetes bacterium]|nr:hypothetical protein [Planctomycetota bacterium]
MNEIIDCGTVRGEIYLFIERELPEDRLRGIAAHIGDCERCREYESRVSDFESVLDRWDAPAPSAGFVEAVIERVAQHERNRRGTFRLQALVWGVRGMLHSTLRIPLPMGIAAAAILVLSVSLNFVLIRPARPTPSGVDGGNPPVVMVPGPSHVTSTGDATAAGGVLGEPRFPLFQPDIYRIANTVINRKNPVGQSTDVEKK